MKTKILEKQLEFPFIVENRKEKTEDRMLLYATAVTLGIACSTSAILDYFNAPQVYDIVKKFIGS